MTVRRIGFLPGLARVLVVVLLPSGLALAGDDTLQACRAIAADGERLACYDRLATAPLAAAAPKEAAPQPGTPAVAAGDAAVAAGAPTPEELFGRDAVAAEQMVREAAGIGRLEEIRQRVASVRANPEDKLVLTLDNGQVWVQLDSPAPRIAAGEEVSIRRAAFGSYLLTAGTTPRGIRVRRLH